MLEQTINIRSFSWEANGLFRKIGTLLVGCLAFVLSSCVPVGDQQVNTSLFKNKEDMKTRAAALKPGMSRKAVFEALDIDPEKFSFMSTQEVQMSIYGNSMVQGSPEELEQFKQRLLRYEGYSLPYRDIKSNGSLGFGTLKVNKNGYDLKLVLIFENNKLMRASVDGNQAVNEDDSQYLWQAVLKRGIGSAF